MVHWWADFNDEQKNLMLKELLVRSLNNWTRSQCFFLLDWEWGLVLSDWDFFAEKRPNMGIFDLKNIL